MAHNAYNQMLSTSPLFRHNGDASRRSFGRRNNVRRLRPAAENPIVRPNDAVRRVFADL
ncbi:MAG: hypothetical protein LBD52_05035 [Prevotellaceae bacterium]|nr:hypothetical protein [Prevotellaceae bacterium]